MKRDYVESRLQAEIVAALSVLGVYALMIPNGEITDMNPKKYTRLVAMGFRPGAPDLLLFKKGENRFFGLEIKRPALKGKKAGKASEGQITFQEKCAANNWPYKIAETLDQAIGSAREWGLCR